MPTFISLTEAPNNEKLGMMVKTSKNEPMDPLGQYLYQNYKENLLN